jgi:YkoY family integral membrane protein
MNELMQNVQDILNNPQASLLVIFNLIIIESLLSVDNAAVLATMVMDLKPEQREKALKYGIIGAYVFRGLCLIFATWLVKVWYLKLLGGLYLLYLVFDYFKSKTTKKEEDDTLDKESNWFYKLTIGWMGQFWATVALVELMDLAFSIDNVFAAVAFSKNIILIWTGVFIGILAMRFVAQAFVNLMEKYPFLETAAFVVIAILGLKLVVSSLLKQYQEGSYWEGIVNGHTTDWIVSALTVAVFVVPILTSTFFNFPARNSANKEE